MLPRTVAFALVLLSSVSSLANADARSDFEMGRNLFSDGQYERASEVFAKLMAEPFDSAAPDAKKRHEVSLAARPLWAATLVALGRVSEAEDVLLAQLRDDPFYEPPAGQLPEPVMQRFIAVASQHAAELDALRKKILGERQELVAREQRDREQQRIAEVARSRPAGVAHTRRSRYTALAPFGVGQFQNGANGLGVFFATSEAVGVAASLATLLSAQHFGVADCRIDDCVAARRGFETSRTANWLSVGLTTALVIAGVIEAQVTLVSEEPATLGRAAAFKSRVEPLLNVGGGSATVGVSIGF